MVLLQVLFHVGILTVASFGQGYPNPDPVNFGEFGGKSYFIAENPYEGVGWNWTDAGEYCQIHGLELGTLETKRELDYVEATLNRNKYHNYYWTSGRDSQSSRQFSWNTTNFQIMETMPFSNLFMRNYGTCIVISLQYDEFLMHPCSNRVINGGVICEKATGLN